MAIHQDSYGFMWFGTRDGLNMFNGIEILVFSHDRKNENSLTNNHITHISEDSDGNLWISSAHGLTRFDRETEMFKRYYIPDIDIDSWIYTSHQDLNGTIWVATREGVYIYDSVGDCLIPFDFPSHLTDRPGRLVKSIYEDNRGNLWFGTFSHGLFCFNPNNSTMKRFHTSSVPSLNNNRVEQVVEDSDGNIWVATYGGGINKINAMHDEIEYFTKESGSDLSNNLVRALFIDKENNLWIGTFDGLNIYNPETNKIETIFVNELDPNGLNNNSIRSIYQDKNENFWIGTYFGGVNIYDKIHQRFKQYTYTPDFKNSINYNVVSAIEEDSDFNLWIGTERGGLNFYDISTGTYSFYAPENKDPTDPLLFTIKSLVLDDKDLWIGTHRQGLFLFDTEKRVFTRIFQKDDEDISDMNSAIINDIHRDQMGFLWLGTESYGGIYKFDPKRKELVSFNLQNQIHEVIQQTPVRSIFQDPYGNLWISTRGQGIIVFNEQTEYIKQYIHNPTEEKSLLNNQVFHVTQDDAGDIWVATLGDGIGRFDRISNEFDFSVSDKGLLHENTFGILDDKKGSLWVVANKGISRFDKEDSIFRNYDMKAGLPVSELTEGAFHRGKYSGKLYFGGIDGFFEVDPETFKDNDFVPPIWITGFRLFNQSIQPGDKTGILANTIIDTREITLKYNQSIFTIEFVALSYSHASSNKYAYILEGLETSWNYVENQNSATYTLLNPGEYTFKVKASNNDGLWNDLPGILKINVLPPPWKTWWAYSIYFMVILLILFLIRFYILKNEQYKNNLLLNKIEQQKLKEINDEKINFFTSISQELRTPLTLILAPVHEVLKSRGLKNEIRNKIDIVLQNARILNRWIDQLVDFKKVENGNNALKVLKGDWVSITKNISSHFEQYAEYKKINFSIRSEYIDIEGYFDSEIIEKVLFNLISNSFANSPENSKIRVVVSKNSISDPNEFLYKKYRYALRVGDSLPIGTQVLILTVYDNGLGLSEKELSGIFDKFYMVPDSFSIGSGIGYYILKSIVSLHHGYIEASSERNRGLCISLIFPLDDVFYIDDKKETSEPGERYLDLQPPFVYSQMVYANTDLEIKENAPLILIIEDNRELTGYIISLLSADYNIIAVSTIREAWIHIKSKPPDLILCDQKLQNRSILNFCKRVKSIRSLVHIPFLLITSVESEENKIESYMAGADAYLTKPFVPDLLKIRIKNLLVQQKSSSINPSKDISNLSIVSPDEKLLQKIKDAVQKRISDPKLNVVSLSKDVGLSRVQFYRKIKELTGLTAIEYLRAVKLEMAANILRQGKLSIKEVAGLTGFSDLDYFRNQFKKKYGITPSTFIETERKNIT
jgi:ligand-binding sensor domain-containing protein/signal transduction histidine kinase/DNA-binding response OmpR family regulator